MPYIEDKSGYLWLATSGHGVLRFDKQKETFAEPIRTQIKNLS